MATIRFLPADKTVQAQPGQTIFELGWKEEVGIQSACVGKGTCGLCRVKIVQGEDSLSPYNEVEDKHLGNLYHLTKLRVSCQCVIVEGAETITVKVKQKKSRAKKDLST